MGSSMPKLGYSGSLAEQTSRAFQANGQNQRTITPSGQPSAADMAYMDDFINRKNQSPFLPGGGSGQQQSGPYSAYGGQAQPQQQSQGTPYNPQQGQNFSGFGFQPGQAQPQQSPRSSGSPYGQTSGQPFGNWNPSNSSPQYGGTGQRVGGGIPRPSDWGVDFRQGEDGQIVDPRYRTGQQQPPAPAFGPGPAHQRQPMQGGGGMPPGGFGNWGNQMQGRPDPFYMDGADPFGNWGGLDQALGQRAAFVNNINSHRGMTAARGMAPRPYDFNQMWGQAADMFQQGWQNPLQGLFG